MTPAGGTSCAAPCPPFRAMAMARLAERARGRRGVTCCTSRSANRRPQRRREHATRPPGPCCSPQTLGYTNAPGLPALRARIAAPLRASGTASRSTATTSSSSPARRRGSPSRTWPAFDSGDRVGVLEPGYPSLPQRPARARHRAGADPRRRVHRWAPTPALLDDVQRRTGRLDGLILASPSNPTGTVLDDDALAGPVRLLRGRGHPADLRRDLPRDLTFERSGVDDAAVHPRRDRRQQLLEVLLDDRLAARVDGRARRPARRGRASPAEPLHLRAGDQPGRRPRRVRLPGRARPPRRAATPRTGTRCSPGSASGHHPHGRRRRGVLRLRRRSEIAAAHGCADSMELAEHWFARAGRRDHARRSTSTWPAAMRWLRLCFAGSTDDVGEAAELIASWAGA